MPDTTAPAPAPELYRGKRRGRELRRGLRARTARETIGRLRRGCALFTLTRGQFSLVDAIEHVLEQTGPAAVVLSSWTAASADVDYLFAFVGDGRVSSLRLVIDASFPGRNPDVCAAIRERFGDGAIRLARAHAKFVTIRNDRWSIVLLTSMNLNENPRVEFLEVLDDGGLADYLERYVEELYTMTDDGEQFGRTFNRNARDLRRVGAFDEDPETFLSDRRYGRDIRRIGWSTSSGRLYR